MANARRYADRFQVAPGSEAKLSAIDPDMKEKGLTKEEAEDELEAQGARMRDLQYLLYAENRRSLLICLQGLDASGKDGTITHVLGAMNPQGTRVHAFKAPTPEEAAHDFLWRAHRQVPARGEVMVFNRSHYEDVLVVRVRELAPKQVWSERYELINAFEHTLAEAGTHILKFYLHISPEEQLERFKDRLDDPARRWKISETDYTDRALWPAYLRAYEDVFARTSTPHAPWYIIPADRKWFRNQAIARIVIELLESLGMETPRPTVDLKEIRRKYHEAADAARRKT